MASVLNLKLVKKHDKILIKYLTSVEQSETLCHAIHFLDLHPRLDDY